MQHFSLFVIFFSQWLTMGAARGLWALPRTGTKAEVPSAEAHAEDSPVEQSSSTFLRGNSWSLPNFGLGSRVGNKKTRVEVIEPGLVVLRSFLSDEECQQVAQEALRMGQQGEDGFYTKDKRGKMILNTGENRGRIYDAASRFPKGVTNYCSKAVSLSRSFDMEMPRMTCTHVLLNMYTTNEGLVWHRDIYENDGKSDHPVVNLCVGASCVFGFRHSQNDPVRTVTLRSGDVILFGGPCRLIEHAVLEVLLNDCPDWMEFPCRFSFTFRDSPEVIGREDEFKYFRVKEHLVGQDTFEAPKNRKSFVGLPSLKSQTVHA